MTKEEKFYSMRKQELMNEAEKNGIAVNNQSSKEEIIKQLLNKLGEKYEYA